MAPQGLTRELVTLGRSAGLDAVGVGVASVFASARAALVERRAGGLHGDMAFTYRNPSRSTDPTRTLPSARSIVVGALSYARREPAPHPPGSGRVARYAWSDHYGDLRDALGEIAAKLVDEGWRAVVLADDNALVDRAAAVRAGIGWYGKNANVLVPGRGSWFVLGAVITDAELTASTPLADGCGSCSRCIDDGCPTGAIVAPGVVDARRCLAWTVQATGVIPRWQRVPLGDRIYGCDDCQDICPPSRVEIRNAPEAPEGGLRAVDVVEMVTMSDEALMDTYGRWYVARREPRHLRRNALVVLANVADPDDPRVVEALRLALAGHDVIVVAHAVWAARRLGLRDLLEAVDPAMRDEPLVASELDGPVALRHVTHGSRP